MKGRERMTCPPEDMWQCLQIFLIVVTEEGATTGIWWTEARDAAKHPAVHRTLPSLSPTKNYPVQIVDSGEDEKSFLRISPLKLLSQNLYECHL